MTWYLTSNGMRVTNRPFTRTSAQYESWRVSFNEYLARKGETEQVTRGWPLASGEHA